MTHLNGDVGRVEAVLLEHNLDHVFAVPGRVHRRLRQQDLALGRVDVQLLRAEGVVPNVKHVFPVPHHPVLHRVVDFKHRPGREQIVRLKEANLPETSL